MMKMFTFQKHAIASFAIMFSFSLAFMQGCGKSEQKSMEDMEPEKQNTTNPSDDNSDASSEQSEKQNVVLESDLRKTLESIFELNSNKSKKQKKNTIIEQTLSFPENGENPEVTLERYLKENVTFGEYRNKMNQDPMLWLFEQNYNKKLRNKYIKKLAKHPYFKEKKHRSMSRMTTWTEKPGKGIATALLSAYSLEDRQDMLSKKYIGWPALFWAIKKSPDNLALELLKLSVKNLGAQFLWVKAANDLAVELAFKEQHLDLGCAIRKEMLKDKNASEERRAELDAEFMKAWMHQHHDKPLCSK